MKTKSVKTKIFAVCIILLAAVVCIQPASAIITEYESIKNIDYFNQYASDFEDYVQESLNSGIKISPDVLVQRFLEENIIDYDLETLEKSKGIKKIRIDDETSIILNGNRISFDKQRNLGISTPVIIGEANACFDTYASDFEDFLNEVGDSLSVEEAIKKFADTNRGKYDLSKISYSDSIKKIDVNENCSIILNGAMISVSGSEVITTDNIPENLEYIKSSTRSTTDDTTDMVNYYEVYYGAFSGLEIFRIGQIAQFSYDGTSTASVIFAEGYYIRGTTTNWAVSQFVDSKIGYTTSPSYTAYARSSGIFTLGVELGPFDIVVQEKYAWISVCCLYTGLTFKQSDIQ